jgi:predicted MFS family arabinose efflux permease
MTLPARTAVLMFLSFAFAYFPSALVRGVIATLAPAFSAELALSAANLGLLAGAYFLGFAVMQLPLGSALDRFGPKRVLMVFLAVAVGGCGAFALAQGFANLTVARALIGMGVSACLMAPMTSFRRNFGPAAQMRANSWMLMTGSLGLVASTLPVQWLLPVLGWRGLFWGLALLFMLAIVLIARVVPADERVEPSSAPISAGGYAQVLRHPTFLRYLPMGFFQYGSMVALQSLWVGPWLTRVCGWSAQETAAGLFAINFSMLLAFMAWGIAVPRLYARGWTAQGLITWGMPLSLIALFLGVALGGEATAWVWALFCVSSTFVSLSQPAIGQAFPATLAGRALSAYNLVIFAGVFVLQWSMGAVIDALMASGWGTVSAFRGAFALMGACCALSYVWFLWRDERSDIRTSTVHTL